MVSCCWAPGCCNRYQNGKPIKLFRFPLSQPELLSKWLKVINRICGQGQTTRRSDGFMEPTEHSRLCSVHFDSGAPSKDPLSIDHVPSIFKHRTLSRQTPDALKRKRARHERLQERQSKIRKLEAEAADTLLSLGSTYQSAQKVSVDSNCNELKFETFHIHTYTHTHISNGHAQDSKTEIETGVYSQTDKTAFKDAETQTCSLSTNGTLKLNFNHDDIINEHIALHQQIDEQNSELRRVKKELKEIRLEFEKLKRQKNSNVSKLVFR